MRTKNIPQARRTEHESTRRRCREIHEKMERRVLRRILPCIEARTRLVREFDERRTTSLTVNPGVVLRRRLYSTDRSRGVNHNLEKFKSRAVSSTLSRSAGLQAGCSAMSGLPLCSESLSRPKPACKPALQEGCFIDERLSPSRAKKGEELPLFPRQRSFLEWAIETSTSCGLLYFVLSNE